MKDLRLAAGQVEGDRDGFVRAWLRSSEALEEESSRRKEKVVDRPSSPSIDTRLSVSLMGVAIETSRGMRACP